MRELILTMYLILTPSLAEAGKLLVEVGTRLAGVGNHLVGAGNHLVDRDDHLAGVAVDQDNHPVDREVADRGNHPAAEVADQDSLDSALRKNSLISKNIDLNFCLIFVWVRMYRN